MNPFEMVVIIVAIVTIGRVIQARHGYTRGMRSSAPAPTSDPDKQMLRDEIRTLKDRIQVLERVITDNHSTADLDREIERLRDK